MERTSRYAPYFYFIVTIQNSIRKTAVSQRSLPHVVTSPYKIAILFECKHSQKAILHGSE